MNANEWIRQSHRWLSIAFTVGVVVNMVAMTRKDPPLWVGLLAGLPLLLLLVSGLYLFVLPYFPGRRRTEPSRTVEPR